MTLGYFLSRLDHISQFSIDPTPGFKCRNFGIEEGVRRFRSTKWTAALWKNWADVLHHIHSVKSRFHAMIAKELTI